MIVSDLFRNVKCNTLEVDRRGTLALSCFWNTAAGLL